MISKGQFAIDGTDAMSFADRFLRWQEWSVQFERESALPGKFRRLINNATEPKAIPVGRTPACFNGGFLKCDVVQLMCQAGSQLRGYCIHCSLQLLPRIGVVNGAAGACDTLAGTDGTISDLMLARSSGLPGYDTAVLAAAAHCTYIPALRNGKLLAVPSTWDVVRVPSSTHS